MVTYPPSLICFWYKGKEKKKTKKNYKKNLVEKKNQTGIYPREGSFLAVPSGFLGGPSKSGRYQKKTFSYT